MVFCCFCFLWQPPFKSLEIWQKPSDVEMEMLGFGPGQKMKANSSKSLYVAHTQSERIRRSTISGLDFGTTESRFAGAMAAIGREFWEFVGICLKV